MGDFDDSEIFNDMLEGGGVDPSVRDDDTQTIRDSIKDSMVSSEAGDDTQQNVIRDTYVMNRMNWIMHLKILFDELESFTQAQGGKQKHVELGNFLRALRKIKTMLPLQAKLDYIRNCGEIAFSYKEVETTLTQGNQRFISWDNIIDVFLTRNQ